MPEPDGNKRKSSDGDIADNLDAALNPAKSYPRKRIAIACDVCRLRKTRCNAQKPCSFCKEAGVNCVYRGGAPPQRPSNAADVLIRIDNRLARLEEHFGASTPSSATASQALPATSHGLPSPASASEVIGQRRNYYQQAVATPHYDFSFRQTAGEAGVARPNLLGFNCPPYMDVESWDDTAEFYDDEMISEDLLWQVVENYRGTKPILDVRTAWRLQQTYVQNFLQWMPLVDLQTLYDHVQVAQKTNYTADNPSTCLTMFVFAVAVISEDKGRSTPREHFAHQNLLPGIEFFSRGHDILQKLSPRIKRSTQMLQCRILYTAYLQFALRPVAAWDAVSEVGRDLMHILSSASYSRLLAADKEALHKIFWICSIVLHEIETVLKMHPVGLRQFHEVVPLPLSENEEEWYYFFFAQASLRKLLTETLDVVGYRVGRVIYAPVVADELRHQAKGWYEHLPPPVRFPLNASPLFDLRKAFLRLQYAALHTVMFWPAVLKILEWSNSSGRAHSAVDVPEGIKLAQQETRSFMAHCTLCCELAEEVLMQRHLGLHFALWAIYSTMTMLIITFRAPGLAMFQETSDDVYVRKAYLAIKGWEELPLIHRGLERTRAQMRRAGIRIDEIGE